MMINSSHYQFEIPPDERISLEAVLDGQRSDLDKMVLDSMACSPPTFHPLALGLMIAAVEGIRSTVPVTWSNLMSLRSEIMKDSEITRRDLPDGMVEISAPGFHCVRKKADWE